MYIYIPPKNAEIALAPGIWPNMGTISVFNRHLLGLTNYEMTATTTATNAISWIRFTPLRGTV